MPTSSVHFPVALTVTSSAVVTGPCAVGGMMLVPTAPATACSAVLQDESGNVMIALNGGASAPSNPWYNLPKPVEVGGYKLSSLTNATAYIYLL